MAQDNTKLLNALADYKEVVDIYIPSAGRAVPFKLLNAEQHKNLMTAAMDGTSAGVTFALTLYECIAANITTLVELKVTDRTYIAVALRAHSLSNIVKRDTTDIDLAPYLANKTSTVSTPLVAVATVGEITIQLAVPSLHQDYLINKESKKKLKTEENEGAKTAREALNTIYTNEILKYISKISFTTDSDTGSIDFTTLPIAQRQKIISNLPVSASKSITDFITKVKERETEFLTLNGQQLELTVDPAFFTV